MQTEGWKLLMQEVLDEEMFTVLDTITGLAVSDPEMQLKFAYLKGNMDFINSIYNLEASVRAGVDEKMHEGLMEGLKNKFRSLYQRIFFLRR